MNHENSFTPESAAGEIKSWEKLTRIKMTDNKAIDSEKAEMAVMTELFEQRKIRFSEADLNEDPGGGWETFDQKVREVFPEIPEKHFRAIKAAVTMELCGQ